MILKHMINWLNSLNRVYRPVSLVSPMWYELGSSHIRRPYIGLWWIAETLMQLGKIHFLVSWGYQYWKRCMPSPWKLKLKYNWRSMWLLKRNSNVIWTCYKQNKAISGFKYGPQIKITGINTWIAGLDFLLSCFYTWATLGSKFQSERNIRYY